LAVIPTPADLRASRAWRDAPSARQAWQRFVRWLRANRRRDFDDGDAPLWQDERRDFSNHRLFTGAHAKHLVLFEKLHAMDKFNGAAYRVSPKRWTIATAAAPFAPFPFDIELIHEHARRLNVPIGFIGDADPHGVQCTAAV
jgi:hypothetical protein